MIRTMSMRYNNRNNSTTKLTYNPYAKPRTQNNNNTTIKQQKTRQSTLNLETNPDNKYSILDPDTKRQGCTRIMFNNINGINTQNQDKIQEITRYMKMHDIDVIGLAEKNTHWNNGNVYKSSLKKYEMASTIKNRIYTHQIPTLIGIRHTNKGARRQ